MPVSAGDPGREGRAGAVRPGAGDWSAADFAWEFLRRNPDYRADYAHSARTGAGAIDPRWGLRFAADPGRPAPNLDVFWRPEAAPGVVLAVESTPSAEELAIGRLQPVLSRAAEDGRHLRLKGGLQVLLRENTAAPGPVMVVLAFDGAYRLRVKAAVALARPLEAPRSRLTEMQRRRLGQALAALDGALGDLSYRQIAETLFGPAALAREPWKTASLRDVTIRLVRAGKALMRGGYLKLLRGGL